MFTFFRTRLVPAPPVITGEPFPYPIPNCPSIAVFPPHFAPIGPVTIATDATTLPQLNVRSIAASIATIRAINPQNWTPEFPIVVLSDCRSGLISDDDRDYIWHRFGVPVFEYLLDANGKILARECEAHDGLHVEGEIDAFDAVLTEEACGCGRPGSRLLGHADIENVKAII
jgi:hypothetical protein